MQPIRMKTENASRVEAVNYSEQEVRFMRDRVYGQRSSDKNWNACMENWMRPDSVAWLEKWLVKPK